MNNKLEKVYKSLRSLCDYAWLELFSARTKDPDKVQYYKGRIGAFSHAADLVKELLIEEEDEEDV